MEARAQPLVPGTGELGASLRAFEYWAMSYRRTWRGSVVSSLLNPVLYLTALGIGLGKLVNHGAHPLGVSYVAYVAPGMLAATAMQIAAFESSYPVMVSIRLRIPRCVSRWFMGTFAWPRGRATTARYSR